MSIEGFIVAAAIIASAMYLLILLRRWLRPECGSGCACGTQKPAAMLMPPPQQITIGRT